MLLAQLGRSAKRLAPSARALCQNDQFRSFAAEPVPDDDDIVLSSFRKQQQQFTAMVQGLQSIPIPLTGDDAAIKKYSQDVEALKKKAGMPSYEEVLDAQLNYTFACAGNDVKKFVSSALEELQLSGPLEDVGAEVAAAVEEAEKASGRPLEPGNDQGWQLLTQRLGDIEHKHGLQDKAKVREEAVFDMYKKHIVALREAVVGEVDKARKADGLEYIEPDLAALKFKP